MGCTWCGCEGRGCWAGAVALFLVASASGMSLFLLLAYDLPFNGGGFFLEPTLLRQVIAD